jgi:hypothetical protein
LGELSLRDEMSRAQMSSKCLMPRARAPLAKRKRLITYEDTQLGHGAVRLDRETTSRARALRRLE